MCDLTQRIADPDNGAFSSDRIKALHLLAASAGTGKTYSIQTLYLRLILIEGLTVQQILVVTFTKDATKELRDRLQHVLREALDYLDGTVGTGNTEDRTKALVDAARGRAPEETLRQRLQLALLEFDMAAIYTIHGFCQRVLNRFAFETRQPFDVEPVGDTSEEVEQLCRDWWRRNVYSMDEKLTGFVASRGDFSLESITALAHKLIAKPDAKLVSEVEGYAGVDEAIKDRLRAFPVQEGETDGFDAMPASIRAAINAIQRMLREFRGYVEREEWGEAVSTLLVAAEVEEKVANPCLDPEAGLRTACEGFKAAAQSARSNAFAFGPDGCLSHPNKPGLIPEHSTRITAAVQRLNALIDSCRPFRVITMRSGKPVKAFDNMEMLCRHFFPEDGERVGQPVTPADLVDAIKTIAKDGIGISEQVTVTADAINPAFRQLRSWLLAENGQAVCRAALEIKKLYQAGRSGATSASFDDYLVNLRDALSADNGLVDVLRKEFRAALIDEFQDTDPVQWGIFERLFRGAGLPCFLVGDPKQAIYRFRNGDVETYLKATGAVSEGARYRLEKNYRAEKRLIDAVNQVFMDGNGCKTFGEGIEYRDPLDAAGKVRDKNLLRNDQLDARPLKILLVENSSKDSRPPGKYSPSAKRAYRVTAEEIARILKDDTLRIGNRKVEKRDIAVLVSKHEEGEYIANELKTLNIPSVRQGTGDVWSTDEGRTLWVWLEATLDSRNLSNVRRALLSAWCGLSVEQIRSLNEGERIALPGGGRTEPYGIEDWVNVFDGFRETWLKRGFPAMFRKLTGTLGLRKRLLGLDDNQGQRRLANINQLCELVERAIVEGRKTPEGTLSWIRRQFDKETADGGDEVNLCLETDDDAVKIMTIFTSKGLEFPIVFAPTLFMMQPRQSGATYEYHDEEGNLHIARKAKDEGVSGDGKEKEREEMEREHVRQIYVALTRAVHRTVVVALGDRNATRDEKPPFGIKDVLGRVLRLPAKKVSISGRDKVVVDMDQVDSRFSNVDGVPPAVEVAKYTGPDDVADLRQEPDKRDDLQPPPSARPKPDTSKGHGSFSSLAPHDRKKPEEAAPAVTAEGDSRNRDAETAGQSVEPAEEKPAGIFAFPFGARTGTCWHEIFEDLPFNADDDAIRRMVEDKLRVHGFLKKEDKRQDRMDVTANMVRNVLRTPLPGLNGAEPFALATVGDRDRKTEWEFSFASLSGKRTRELQEVVAGYEPYGTLLNSIGQWDKEIPGGYLTGFLDLLFRHAGRFYIADWKSNRRSGRQSDFGQSGLREEMALHGYWLQYLIYTVAVHQYLSKALAGYRYEEHFGGVYYVFLRGVDGNRAADGSMNGVYADRPPRKLVDDLSGILGDFS